MQVVVEGPDRARVRRLCEALLRCDVHAALFDYEDFTTVSTLGGAEALRAHAEERARRGWTTVTTADARQRYARTGFLRVHLDPSSAELAPRVWVHGDDPDAWNAAARYVLGLASELLRRA